MLVGIEMQVEAAPKLSKPLQASLLFKVGWAYISRFCRSLFFENNMKFGKIASNVGPANDTKFGKIEHVC